MMKRAFIFVLALALFIAISGGYGQIINSDWVARSFISADQNAEEYPQLDKDKTYTLYVNSGTQSGRSYETRDSRAGIIVDQKGKWITLRESSTYYEELRGYTYRRINLEYVYAIEHYESLED